MLKANHIGCITALKDSCEHPDDDAGVGGFAPAPASWHYLGSSAAIAARPHRFDLPGGQSFVAFRPPGQPVVVLGARCSHMGADLSRGCVRAGRIVCPLHGWEYAADGKCARIPCGDAVPEFARQRVHPVAEVGGQVFFFNGAEARFPMPFFDGVNGDDLHAARAFDIHEDVPWHLVIANGFDRQHFEKTHERTLLAEPVVDVLAKADPLKEVEVLREEDLLCLEMKEDPQMYQAAGISLYTTPIQRSIDSEGPTCLT